MAYWYRHNAPRHQHGKNTVHYREIETDFREDLIDQAAHIVLLVDVQMDDVTRADVEVFRGHFVEDRLDVPPQLFHLVLVDRSQLRWLIAVLAAHEAFRSHELPSPGEIEFVVSGGLDGRSHDVLFAFLEEDDVLDLEREIEG